MANGIVYLIGAGPGNPKLITVRGLECLHRAEVVVYDRLGTTALLQEVRPGAEIIYVGKTSGNHAMPQEEINQLLIRKAEEGKVVARLKGGDPFVFGRGGEEAVALAERGIPFEVIPGITSAIAAPAYAGIPVTHRKCTSTFAIVTGHEDPTKESSSVDWPKISTGAGTIVFLMGLANLGGIVRKLLECGRPPETPVALIRWGTRADQQTVTGTLTTIEAEAARARLTPPVVIVVGEVVGLRSQLRWFHNRPLFGHRLGVVRGWDQGGALAEHIEHLGGEVVDFRVVHGSEAGVVAAGGAAAAQAIHRLQRCQWLVFTSAGGVDQIFRHLEALGLDARALAGPRLVALGNRTVQALSQRGIRPDCSGEDGRILRSVLDAQRLSAVAFADAGTLVAWCKALGTETAPVPAGVPVACRDQAAARTLGLAVDLVPEEATDAALADGLARLLQGQGRQSELTYTPSALLSSAASCSR